MAIALLTAIHVVGVVIWIGGVVFVTIIVFPMIMRMEQSFEKVMFFQGVEHRFAKVAKICVFFVGTTGMLLLMMTEEYKTLFTLKGIGPTIMLFVWTFYFLVLMFEAKVFAKIFSGEAQHDMHKVFGLLTRFHYVVMGVSLTAVAVGVGAKHYIG
ncbi:MAG: hypothetical protein SFH39_02545 [Candidatus Magnetobacterium sp. LHC-1]|uniref:Copper resistance protein D domain-containing protein n=1 Tax=Candidatus Magnetobacterium casense TaxID=1455061 RepID=A0ABS6S2A9_9BACT|nr:hypothetical protein [Candidatus Magnetobacterium casensis]MBF0607529.1 hypothetical protein [Nitrospirota bacterium]MBV6342974.1 hypothetical protein [Candidatus Magnetobacterium casensis]